MEQITILGCGTWGSALSQCLALNGHSVYVWHYKSDALEKMSETRKHPKLDDFTFHENINFDADLNKCISKSKIIVASVPSHAIRELMIKSKNYFTNDCIIVNVAKGLENNTLKRMSEVILDEIDIDEGQVVSLYGPSHAEEVIKGFPTTLVSASINESSSKKIQNIFSSKILRVYTNNDIKGVEIAGSIKNVIAIAAGICDGIGYGDNTKAALLTRGISEITRLGEAMGANISTFSGLSGIGDLIVTCLSKHSRNRFLGESIGKGKKLNQILSDMDMVAEGVNTTKSVYDLSNKYDIDMPISIAVYKVLFHEEDPKTIVSDLMTRELSEENF